MVMRRFIILKIQPLQVLAIKIETRLLLIKPFTVKVLITIGDTKESWGIVSLTTRQALNSGLQQLQQFKWSFMKIQVTTRRFGKPLILSVVIAIHIVISTIPLVFGV